MKHLSKTGMITRGGRNGCECGTPGVQTLQASCVTFTIADPIQRELNQLLFDSEDGQIVGIAGSYVASTEAYPIGENGDGVVTAKWRGVNADGEAIAEVINVPASLAVPRTGPMRSIGRERYASSDLIWIVQCQHGVLTLEGRMLRSGILRNANDALYEPFVEYEVSGDCSCPLDVGSLPVTFSLTKLKTAADYIANNPNALPGNGDTFYTYTGFPATVEVTECASSCDTPLVPCSGCTDPVPCGFRALGSCTSFEFRPKCFNNPDGVCLYYTFTGDGTSRNGSCAICTWDTTVGGHGSIYSGSMTGSIYPDFDQVSGFVLDISAGTITPNPNYNFAPPGGLPSYTIKAGTTFDCHACNVFERDPGFTNPSRTYPEMLEVVPILEEGNAPCNQPPDCGYDTAAVRNTCCDICCSCGAGNIRIDCCYYDTATDSYVTGTKDYYIEWCKGDPMTEAYNEDDAGVTREGVIDFVDCNGDHWQLKSVIYCDGSGLDGWYMDLYYRDYDVGGAYTYLSTISLEDVTCCPFSFGFTLPGLTFATCEPGSGGVIDLACCGEVPDTLTLTVTDITPDFELGGCDCLLDAEIVMTWSAANAAFMGSFEGCSETLYFTIYCAGDPSEPRLFVTLEPYPTYVTVYSQTDLDCDDLVFGGVVGLSAPNAAVDDCFGSLEITIS